MSISGADGRSRGRRRDEILEAAADLFSEQGYQATGIDEIGAAAGITGPGVYRHFDNKNDVLGHVVQRAVERVVEGVADVVSEADDAWEVLEGLVDNVVGAVLEDPASWAVVVREQRHLDPVSRRGLGRAHRLHVEEWVHALSQVRPELTDGEARVMVHGALGMGLAICNYKSGLEDDALVELMRSMILTSLRPPAQAAKTRRRKAAVPSRETA